MPRSSGKAQSSSSMAVPSAAFEALRDLQQTELDRHVGAEQVAGGDAEEQRVTDLAAAPVTVTFTGVRVMAVSVRSWL